jgi:hypothetical protein
MKLEVKCGPQPDTNPCLGSDNYSLHSSSHFSVFFLCTPVYPSVLRLATGWTFRGSNPGGEGEIFHTRPDRPLVTHPASYTMGIGSFPGGKAAGALCWPPTPIYVPRSWKGRAKPLLTLWVFVACYRENFFFLHLINKSVVCMTHTVDISLLNLSKGI